ncbi:DUF4232 domain-containing protein [Streptomyces sp. NPDC049813]|uniref:DUF4232 domain-containing protein n=1 Tax=Streptomyces sp. NPDC049813 TaxID=3365597 RepID=UPI0037AF7CFC
MSLGVVAATACGAESGDGQARASTPTTPAGATTATEHTEPPTASGSATAATTRAGTPAPSATDTRDTTSAQAGTRSDCTTDDLKVGLKATGQEMNSKYFDLTLTNTTDRTCALKGYPGLSLTDSAGARIGKPATRSQNGSVQDVRLTPGHAAHAVVQTPDRGVTDGKCWAEPAHIKVYPPDNTASLTAAAPDELEVCGNSFTVGPFTPRAL